MSEAAQTDILDQHPDRLVEPFDGTVAIRLSNCFHNENITTVRSLIAYSERDLLRIPNFGHRMLDKLKAQLEDLGLHLRDPDRRDGTLPLPFPSVHLRLTRIEQRLDRLERMAGRPLHEFPDVP